MTGRTKATGRPNHADLLQGSAAGTDFFYTVDGVFKATATLTISGDPGHPGPGIEIPINGATSSHDVFVGVAGAHNVVTMGDGHKALFLGSGTEAAAPGPRLVNIDEIRAGSGGQFIDLTTPNYTYGNVFIRGGSGNDVLAGNAGNDTITGGGGKNLIWGGSGNDLLKSGYDLDVIGGGDGNDTILGGGGDDTLDGSAGDDSIRGGLGAERIWGGDGADRINSGAGNDTIYGGAGADTILAGAGDDGLYGGDGSDRLMAGSGSDSVEGGLGDDTIFGGDGSTIPGAIAADRLSGGDGNDVIHAGAFGTTTVAYGGDGNDTLTGGSASSLLIGDAGNDVIVAKDGHTTIDGGDGNDRIVASSMGGDSASGGAGDDTIIGSASATPSPDGSQSAIFNGGIGNDLLQGGAVAVAMYGGPGSDTIIGGAGRDTIHGGAGSDSIEGGIGQSTLTYQDSGNAVTVDLGTGVARGGDAEGDHISNIHGLIGSVQDDRLTGSTGNDTIYGFDGNDTITGGSGDDSLVSGSPNDKGFLDTGTTHFVMLTDDGNDTIVGGHGTDVVDYSAVGSAVLVSLDSNLPGLSAHTSGGAGADILLAVHRVIGTAFGDTLIGGVRIDGGDGNDSIVATNQGYNATQIGGHGSDTYDATARTTSSPVNFGITVDGPSVDTILGFSDAKLDRLYASLGDLGLASPPAHSPVAGSTVSVAGGFAVADYDTPDPERGDYGISWIIASADAVLNISGGTVTATTATTSHAQFIFDQSSGDLWFDADGSRPGEATKIAHLDLGTTTASAAGATGVALEASDFLLIG